MVGTTANDSITVTRGSIRGQGLDGNDHIIVTGSSSFGEGGDGDDVIELQGLNSVGVGGAGADTFVVEDVNSFVRVSDFEDGIDKIAFKSGASNVSGFGDLTITASGSDTIISYNGGDEVRIEGVATSALSADDFIFEGSSGGGSGGGTGGGGGNSTPSPLPTITLENAAGQAGSVVTFGHVFEKGAIASTETIQGKISDTIIDLQMDVKKTWDDGSVKHAIISMETPSVSSGTVMSLETTAPGTPTNIDVKQAAIAANYDFEVRIDGGQTIIDVDQLLQNQTGEQWIEGEFASEVRVVQTLSNNLTFRFDIRAKSDGTIDTSVTAAYDDITVVGSSDLTYDVEIRDGGQVVFSESQLEHTHHANWRETFTSSGSNSATHVVFDIDYMSRTGIMPSYDTDIDAALSNYFGDMISITDFGPMGAGNIQKVFGGVGGRPDIGYQTEWTALYLLDQDIEAKEAMLQNAEAGGSIPWHYTDPATAFAVRADHHPGKSWPYQNQTWTGTNIATNQDGWGLEAGAPSHKPSLSSTPYMLTGDRYFLEETYAEVAYGLFSQNPNGTTALRFSPIEQLRGQAWLLRDIFTASELAPDGAYADYLEDVLDERLQGYVDFYVNGQAFVHNGQSLVDPWNGTELEGVLRGNPHSAWADGLNDGLNSPWQQDYFGIVVGQIAKSGNEKAKSLSEWMANFSAGRFLQDDYEASDAIGYRLQDSEKSSVSPGYVSTWSDLNDDTQAAYANNSDALTNVNGFDYPTIAWGSLASLFSGTHLTEYAEAYLWVADAAKARIQNFSSDNGQGNHKSDSGTKFGIMPTFNDGSQIDLADHEFGTNSADTLNGGSENNLFTGNGSNDSISAGDGHNLVDGGAGDDVIFAGIGDDWLFGGEGSDTINGGDGLNYLQGDRYDRDFVRSSDTFQFVSTLGETTIGDFDVNEDFLSFSGVSGASNANEVLSGFVNDGGDALLDLGGAGSLRLQGVDAALLDQNDLIFV